MIDCVDRDMPYQVSSEHLFTACLEEKRTRATCDLGRVTKDGPGTAPVASTESA